MDPQTKDFLLKRESTPATPERETSVAVAKKREELELKKLEIEIANLSKQGADQPNVWEKMLEQERTHNKEMIDAIEKRHSDHEALSERISQLEADLEAPASDDDFIKYLIPLLSQRQNDEWAGSPYVPSVPSPPIQQQGGENMGIKEVIGLIKGGLITEQGAYAMLKAHFGDLIDLLITPEEFHEKFEKLKSANL